MKTALDFKRPSQPILARLLDKLVQESGGEESARTTSLVSALVEDAQRERASDVHLDPDSDGFQLRFRIDGAVIDTLRLSSAVGKRIVRACKSLADLEPGNCPRAARRPCRAQRDWSHPGSSRGHRAHDRRRETDPANPARSTGPSDPRSTRTEQSRLRTAARPRRRMRAA